MAAFGSKREVDVGEGVVATEVMVGVTARIRGHRALYLEVDAPGQRMALPIPEAELPVMATGCSCQALHLCLHWSPGMVIWEGTALGKGSWQQRWGCGHGS